MFQEYPKMLYKGDDNTIAQDAEHEKQLREIGWLVFGEEAKTATEAKSPETQPAQRGRGRAAKTAAETGGE